MQTSDLNEFLEGFEFIESDRLPSVTLDKNGRFNPNIAARRLLAISPNETITIGYNPLTKEIVFIPYTFAGEAEGAGMSSYNVDKRFYLSARAFSKNYGYAGKISHFDYVRGMSNGAAFVFRLRES